MSRLRVAVVGAGGNIGRTLLVRLNADPAIEAVGICRNEPTAAPLRLAGLAVRCGTVSEPASAQELLGDREVIVNASAATALPGTARQQDRAVVLGLLGVRGPRRLIHFSSVAVYGSCITAQNTVAHPRPDYTFGRDKLDLERFLRRRAQASAFELTIVRSGHVYGAEQWVSRFVFDQLDKPGWKLPFDGRYPSNAVHVRNVAAAVRALVLAGRVGTFNLFDAPQSTWRQVFDWNTTAVGAAPIAGLDDAASERVRRHFAAISRAPTRALVAEVAAWGKSLPLSLAASSQQVRFLALSALATLQSPRLEAHVVKRFFGGHLARRVVPLPVEQPWLVSDAAPGPSVEYHAEVDDTDRRDVARWYQGYASPDALWPIAPPGADVALGQV